MQTLNKTTTPAIDKAMFDKLLAVPAIQAAFAEATASDEAIAAAARKTALDARAEAENALAELAGQRDGLDLAIAQLQDEINSLKRDRYEVHIAIQRSGVRCRDLEIALRDEHGGRLIQHVANYLGNVARNAEHAAERQATLKLSAGQDIRGNSIMKQDPKAQAKAEELREAAIGLREAVEAIAALEVEPISPQEIRRRIQTQLERIGLTLYRGALDEHMLSRQVHVPGQEHSVELVAPKIAA